MKKISSRPGSAILVVLGMTAFLLVSAIAFSAYMRYSRLPSSYLRRTSASRHLVHAAMAEAIDYIDLSIGDNPHPGFGDKATQYPRLGGDLEKRNYWQDNCFIGTNQLMDAEETVSVLSLEALAYIPPALVNEARYYSRIRRPLRGSASATTPAGTPFSQSTSRTASMSTRRSPTSGATPPTAASSRSRTYLKTTRTADTR